MRQVRGFPGRALLGLAAAVLVLGLAAALWPSRADGPPPPVVGAGSGTVVPEARPSPPRTPPPGPALPPPTPALPAEDALSRALNEERVPLASSVVVERIDQDRPWVCAGEPLGLSAHLGGPSEPGMVFRWVWPTAGGGAELHPGPMLQWRAPAAAGRYRVRFQVCKDLGGRRVGVLAERDVELDVRPCGAGQRQEEEPLRIEVVQRRAGTFAFHALYQGQERLAEYTWDFGDGSRVTTAEPEAEHTYETGALGAQDVRSFTVKLAAHRGRGEPLQATAFALTRGQPPSDEPPPVQLQVSRWRPLPEGGWRSDLVVQSPGEGRITWERLERVIVRWDGEVHITTRPWNEVVRLEEDLGSGGFRGHVTVSPAEVPPEVKQVLDFLYGRDAAGKEVMVSWSPFKREASPAPPPAEDRPPVK
jgi:hypothetical protein